MCVCVRVSSLVLTGWPLKLLALIQPDNNSNTTLTNPTEKGQGRKEKPALDIQPLLCSPLFVYISSHSRRTEGCRLRAPFGFPSAWNTLELGFAADIKTGCQRVHDPPLPSILLSPASVKQEQTSSKRRPRSSAYTPQIRQNAKHM